jgi:hypothetical protein
MVTEQAPISRAAGVSAYLTSLPVANRPAAYSRVKSIDWKYPTSSYNDDSTFWAWYAYVNAGYDKTIYNRVMR